MKKIVLLSLVVVAAATSSCKKIHTCSCVGKVSGGGSSTETKTSEKYDEKMKEKQATASCDYTQKVLENQLKADYNGTGASTSASCELK